jgi:hypothetical protein
MQLTTRNDLKWITCNRRIYASSGGAVTWVSTFKWDGLITHTPGATPLRSAINGVQKYRAYVAARVAETLCPHEPSSRDPTGISSKPTGPNV